MTATSTVTVTLPAGAARLAADALYQAARDARDADETAFAEHFEAAAEALHTAGWAHIA